MQRIQHPLALAGSIVLALSVLSAGCGAPTTTTTNTVSNININSNANVAAANTNFNSSTAPGTTITTSEPDQYQANIKMSLEAIGEAQTAKLPALGAMVARSGADRVMEFALPTGEKVIYLDKGGMNYIILPNRKQYAELSKEAVGFEVRRLLMPDQIVEQVKAIPGVRQVGEETVNGRAVVKYAYSAASQTQTQAGTVATESFVLVDKQTGLPVRTETVSQSQSGGNVQGYKGVRVVTEMTDIETTPAANIFMLPTDYQKIDSEQVKAQASLIFNAVGALIGQVMQQAQPPAASPSVSPSR
ncbi:MAG TPA: hypothetical protein VNA22_02305 [Pyrinomonadaceae bacterium]|nr:hypothetical protein [Pyrinomonadaceae bacterium]